MGSVVVAETDESGGTENSGVAEEVCDCEPPYHGALNQGDRSRESLTRATCRMRKYWERELNVVSDLRVAAAALPARRDLVSFPAHVVRIATAESSAFGLMGYKCHVGARALLHRFPAHSPGSQASRNPTRNTIEKHVDDSTASNSKSWGLSSKNEDENVKTRPSSRSSQIRNRRVTGRGVVATVTRVEAPCDVVARACD